MSLNGVVLLLKVILVVSIIAIGSFFGYRYWKNYYVPVEVASQVSNKQLKIADIFSLESYLKEIGLKHRAIGKDGMTERLIMGFPQKKLKWF